MVLVDVDTPDDALESKLGDFDSPEIPKLPEPPELPKAGVFSLFAASAGTFSAVFASSTKVVSDPLLPR